MMGKLAIFGKVAIEVRGRDHLPPHFHVTGPDVAALVGIEPLVILRGSLPAALWRNVQAWAVANRALLVAEWNRHNPRFPM